MEIVKSVITIMVLLEQIVSQCLKIAKEWGPTEGVKPVLMVMVL